MSCNTCSRKFNLFTPERGCPSCGFSYCGKCLTYPILVEKYNKIEKVCSKCKMKADTANLKEAEPSTISPTITERVDIVNISLKMPEKATAQTGLSEEDKKLVDRLEALKRDQAKLTEPSSSKPKVEDIKARLAILKGEDPSIATAPSKPLKTVDPRNDEEKVMDLMKQMMEECNIDGNHSSMDEDLQRRLSNLRGDTHIAKTIVEEFSDDEDDEEKQMKKIINKLTAEAALEGDNGDNLEEEVKEDDELPWCFICNEDAVLRCLDCSGDLFCRSCYKESHKEWNYPDHKSKPFKAKRKDLE